MRRIGTRTALPARRRLRTARRLVRSALCVLCAVVLTPAAARSAARLDVSGGVESARIALTWPQDVATTAEIDGREVYLGFDRPLGDPDAAVFGSLQPAWIDWVQFGHSSLLIHAARDVVYSVASGRTGVEVLMRAVEPDPPGATAPAEVHAEGVETRLQCLQGATLLASWDLTGAERLLDGILEREPDNLDAVLLTAQTAERQEHWRRAVAAYDRAIALAVPLPEVQRARERLWREHGDGLQVDTYLRDVSNAEQRHVTRLQGRLLSRDGMTVSARVTDVAAEIDDLVRVDGRVGSFDAPLVHGELSADWRGEGIARTRMRLYAGPGGVGAGLGQRLGEARAQTDLDFDIGEPYLEYVQGLADEGVRDRLSVRHQRRLGERWTAALGLSANRYGLSGLPTAARSLGIRAIAGCALLRGDPSVYLEYRLDVERIDVVAERRDPHGDLFRPLPLVDRQAHSVGCSVGRALSPRHDGAVLVGYSHDPLNGRGAFGELSLGYHPDAHLVVAVRASFGLDMQRSDSARYRELGADVHWSF